MIILMALVGLYYRDQMPERIPIHFDIKGNPDNWMIREQAIWLIPAIALAAYLLFSLVTHYLFKGHWGFLWKTLMMFFLANAHIASLFYAMNRGRSMLTMMIPSIILGIVYLAVLFKRLSP